MIIIKVDGGGRRTEKRAVPNDYCYNNNNISFRSSEPSNAPTAIDPLDGFDTHTHTHLLHYSARVSAFLYLCV